MLFPCGPPQINQCVGNTKAHTSGHMVNVTPSGDLNRSIYICVFIRKGNPKSLYFFTGFVRALTF